MMVPPAEGTVRVICVKHSDQDLAQSKTQTQWQVLSQGHDTLHVCAALEF